MPDNVYAVFGLNYGSEGKGAVINYLGHKHADDEIIGIKPTGSINSSQNVFISDKIQHEFRHFSSATGVGARTYLGANFICDPSVFKREREDLIGKGILVRHAWVHLRCKLITPYDVLANQMDAINPSGRKSLIQDGTSGLGVYYTDRRGERRSFSFEHLKHHTKTDLKSILHNIKAYYEDGFWGYSFKMLPEFKDIWNSPLLISNFLDDIDYFLEYTTQIPEDAAHLSAAKTLIFEMPLGLGLNRYQSAASSPFVTDASEINNILMKTSVINDIKSIYVTRPYSFRLGAKYSPFPDHPDYLATHSNIAESLPKINQFQDNIRLGPLNIPIIREVMNASGSLGDQKHLAITCLDQFQGVPIPYHYRKDTLVTEKKFLNTLPGQLRMKLAFKSYGPKKEAMVEL